MCSHHENTLSPHQEFASVHADLHGIIAERLRSPDFQVLLNELVSKAPVDALVRATAFWKSEGWPDNSIGPAVGRLAKSGGLAATVGWFLAVKSGNTVRAVLPIGNWKLLQQRMLVIPEAGASVLTPERVLKAMHATINLSFAMRSGSKGHPHKGMFLASLEEALPLYWGNVRPPDGSKVFEVIAPDGRRISFVSVARESEQHLGLASVMYIPLPSGSTPECIIALYSPVPHVFGNEPLPIAVNANAVSAIQEVVFPGLRAPDNVLATLLHSLQLNDRQLGRDEARLTISSMRSYFTRDGHKDTVVARLTECTPSQIILNSDDLPLIIQSLTKYFSDKFTNGSLNIVAAIADRSALGLQTDSLSWTQDGILDGSNGNEGTLRKEMADLVTRLRQLIENALPRGNQRVVVTLSHDRQRHCCSILASNECLIDYRDYEHFLWLYWIARHSHLREDGSDGGFGLFDVSLFCTEAGLGFILGCDVPQSFPGQMRWITQVDIPLAGAAP